ncbi:Protein CBG24939, partial [Caenorhabditis briggsae]
KGTQFLIPIIFLISAILSYFRYIQPMSCFQQKPPFPFGSILIAPISMNGATPLYKILENIIYPFIPSILVILTILIFWKLRQIKLLSAFHRNQKLDFKGEKNAIYHYDFDHSSIDFFGNFDFFRIFKLSNRFY